MRMTDVETLDSARTWWVPAVRAPMRDWAGAPGCRRGARFLIDEVSLRPAHDNYPCFATREACLRWIATNGGALARTAPGAEVAPADLARWLLGLA